MKHDQENAGPADVRTQGSKEYGAADFARDARITRAQAEILIRRHGNRTAELKALAYSLRKT